MNLYHWIFNILCVHYKMNCTYPSCIPVAHKRVYEDLKQIDTHKPRPRSIPKQRHCPSKVPDNNKQYVILTMIVLIFLILKD